MTASAAGNYNNAEYWDQRYAPGAPGDAPKHFDWFFNYSALRQLFKRYLHINARVLHVGCGNSNLQEGMAMDGYRVTNVDISPVVIERMKLQHSQLAGLDYLVADCRDMSSAGLPGGSFGSCIDKGTLDAVLCGASGQLDAARYMQEICRLLRPGGIFLLISLGAPSARLALLQKLGLWQDVQVLLLPKPLLYLQSDAAMSGRPPPAATAPSKDAPVEALGPWPAAVALAELAARRNSGALDERDYFFAYVCTTPGSGGEAVPAGEGAMPVAGAAEAAAGVPAAAVATGASVQAAAGAGPSNGGYQEAVQSEFALPALAPEPALVGSRAESGAAPAALLSEPLAVAAPPVLAEAREPGLETNGDTVSNGEGGTATEEVQQLSDARNLLQGLSLA
ncbi:hypothetical protein CHLRE_10g446300v5 [Chlamydomonas reinhardtii]|uniref:Methyltransferase type 11 domain-containing protein n=1 Tax=Chlamydomonas reinhardtii TaxID=3055 RepID=A0A2K3DAV1_CHLRE|nr:uncharacterized protein CHLRE_10g446300v5 [Chlamydomonas reinhardtii]PNW77665.1 hypothetical protein CHLRE_10g446300v5 [Chlamydomonas reinhardtii]